jgi:hypothetical protein
LNTDTIKKRTRSESRATRTTVMPMLTNAEFSESNYRPQEKIIAIFRTRVFTYIRTGQIHHFGSASGRAPSPSNTRKAYCILSAHDRSFFAKMLLGMKARPVHRVREPIKPSVARSNLRADRRSVPGKADHAPARQCRQAVTRPARPPPTLPHRASRLFAMPMGFLEYKGADGALPSRASNLLPPSLRALADHAT